MPIHLVKICCTLAARSFFFEERTRHALTFKLASQAHDGVVMMLDWFLVLRFSSTES